MARTFNAVRRKLVGYEGSPSLSDRLRADRFRLLLDRYPELGSMRVLDLGGTSSFWARAPVRPSSVVLLNLAHDEDDDVPWITSVVGDVCTPPEVIRRERFDLVFSNSVIEHVGGHVRRMQMAEFAMDSADRYWIQTPYRYFPIEPHWLFPGFQFLPPNLQARIGARWPLTWAGRVSYDVALGHALEVELLGRTQLRYYFPDAAILRERVAGLTKSLIATR
jgi:hypothetical protein